MVIQELTETAEDPKCHAKFKNLAIACRNIGCHHSPLRCDDNARCRTFLPSDDGFLLDVQLQRVNIS